MYNIGIDGHMLGDHSGGNESYYSNVLQNMDIPGECKIYLFMKPGVDDTPYKDKFEIVRFKSKNAFVRNFWELSLLCKKLKLDLLHTQYFIPFWRPCKVVCTIHDICFEHFKDIFTKKEYYRQKILIPYAAKRSSAVFTVSNHAKNDIIEHYCVPEEKIIVTYNAVNESFRHMNDEEVDSIELRKKFGIGDGKYILSVCNLQPRKNLVRLINAFVAMKEKYAGDEQLVIVGKKAWMFNDILKTAIAGNEDIIFTDYVSNEDLVRLYNDATCFVYPSFFEGFGIPPLEAMACGTPVAVANATSLPEVVGNAGMYFDPFNTENIECKIVDLIKLVDSNQVDHVKMKRQVDKFSWKESAEKIASSYVKTINAQ